METIPVGNETQGLATGNSCLEDSAMITSKEDYIAYLKADLKSLNRKDNFRVRHFDPIVRFQRLLRKLEYLVNCKKSKIRIKINEILFNHMSVKLGFTIPLNIFGPGLSIAHRGTIVINGATRVGANCRIHVCVNIGTAAGYSNKAPTIGDNCYIGPGAKLFGPIILGDNIAIGANAVVNKSYPEGNVILGGVPAKVIAEGNSLSLLIQGWNIERRAPNNEY
jgi:serine O-acetyltransferase